jgi:cystathionine gamma-lyase
MKIPADAGFMTQAIHAGQSPDPTTGAIMTPIFQTSTYVQDGPGGHKGYEYSRTQNPTRTALEQNLAALEGAKHGLCFASGCAATTSICLALEAGDHIIASDDLYGGTFRLFDKVFKRFGLKFSFVDMTNSNNVAAAMTKETKLVWIETPTNPMLKLADIAAISAIATKGGVATVVDNTFASPVLQQPLSLGATMVLHSTTKYLGGHSDVIGGAILTSSDEWRQRLAFVQNSAGGVPAPMDCFLVLRSTKTLGIRVQRHVENAQQIVEVLTSHPKVEKVYYPGLTSHPQYELMKRQMKGPGAMISFVVKGGLEGARKLLTSTRIFACAESLGGVESLIEHPAIMTHASIPAAQRKVLGIDDGLIRISVGIEDIADLKADLLQALAAV